MHCPYCGVLLENAQACVFQLYKAHVTGPQYIVTCEENGERHHVLLSEWGVGAKLRPHHKPGPVTK